MNINKLGPVLVNALTVGVTCVIGVAGQWFFFADAQSGWMFLFRWPILWVLYFLLANLLVLHGAHLIARVVRLIDRE